MARNHLIRALGLRAAAACILPFRATLVVWLTLAPGLAAQPTDLPNLPASLKFAVIGDSGTGETPQYDVGDQMAREQETFRFDLALMLGDNIYGRHSRNNLIKKFERPYEKLLSAGVVFQAALGNHDSPQSRFYPLFNMNGLRYYTFVRNNVRFLALDSGILRGPQLTWLDSVLADAREEWLICYFHHPLYSHAARHGSDDDNRALLEPILVKHGVDVVFSGHDHVYERIAPQKGIHYFVVGSSGQLRRGNLRRSPLTTAGFDRDRAFLLVEIEGDRLHFRAVSRTGMTVDSGVLVNTPRPALTRDEPLR